MEMRAKCKKMESITVSTLRQNKCQTEPMGQCSVNGYQVQCVIPHSLLQLPMLMDFAFISYCLMMQNIKGNVLMRMQGKFLMNQHDVLVAYEMIHIANAKGSKTDNLILLLLQVVTKFLIF